MVMLASYSLYLQSDTHTSVTQCFNGVHTKHSLWMSSEDQT